MLQSWQYGHAKQTVENWDAHRYIIINENGEDIALVQVLIKKIPIIGSIARINRGPLILKKIDEQKKERIILNVISALITKSRNSGWRMLQIAPEINNTEAVIGELKNLGLRQLSVPPWASGLLLLDPNKEELLMGLNGKWRNCLRKGLRSKFSVKKYDIDIHQKVSYKISYKILQKILNNYKKLKHDNQFSGISESLLESIALQSGDNWETNLFIANENIGGSDDDPIGMLVSIDYGDTSIYLIGTTNLKGRKLNANYVLLWEAILSAKNEGCKWFDIGGLNSTTPPGIAHFKKGLNAKPYELAGEWRIFNFPWMRMIGLHRV